MFLLSIRPAFIPGNFHFHFYPPRKVTWLAGNSTMNEDAFPIENRDFPVCHVKRQDIEKLITQLDIT